jgi:hypothetical protein
MVFILPEVLNVCKHLVCLKQKPPAFCRGSLLYHETIQFLTDSILPQTELCASTALLFGDLRCVA